MEARILYKSHQHSIVAISKALKLFLLPGIILSGIMYFIGGILASLITFVVLGGLLFGYTFFFWKSSYFVITNQYLLMDVRNGLFSRFTMNIYFNQIKDFAYSKNHLFHYVFHYGMLFVRSSAGSDGNFIVPDIPNIEEVYKIINYLYTLGDKRKEITSLDDFLKPTIQVSQTIIPESRVLKELLAIPGIVEAKELSVEDRRYIFEHEEDRNHGVYECLKRQKVFVVTHDELLRDPDGPIVLKLGNKVIFPAVSFHEIKEKNTISSSPGVVCHEYLCLLLKHVGPTDATLLIGYDTH